jgi:two-component system, OmpR family, alkaline phosphatase synthesis response regulator PhoP
MTGGLLMWKILIVEDEILISDLIVLNLNSAGFDTIQAFNGLDGLEYIRTDEIDLVLLDIMLPKMDGFELIPYIIEKGLPVIFLTAKNSLKDRVYGLNMGADDYIVKPFEGIELIARVKAVLRRKGKYGNVKVFGDIQIFLDRRKVFKSNKEIKFTAKEFELLEYLVENAGIALSREKLLEMVWGYDYFGNTRTVDMHIQRLRTKLETIRIETVFKMGYRLEV